VSSASNVLVEIKNVKKYFNKVHALDGVSLSLIEGEQYVIQGASGSGKSTLLYLMGGLDQATSGEVWVNKKNLAKLGDGPLARFRNLFVGFVFQFHFLLPSMNCLNNILLPSRIGGISSSEVVELVNELAKELGVDHCLNKFPYQLSGGEQQRINIIRALSLRPKLLLCDEPTGNLDSNNSSIVVSLLRDLAQKFGATLVIVTHNSNIASQFVHKVNLCDGRLVR
jgi:ABC-type lipoprotein export system ATPase subunit